MYLSLVGFPDLLPEGNLTHLSLDRFPDPFSKGHETKYTMYTWLKIDTPILSTSGSPTHCPKGNLTNLSSTVHITLSLLVFSEPMLNYLKRRNAKKGIVNQSSRWHIFLYMCTGVLLCLCLYLCMCLCIFLCLFLCLCRCLCLEQLKKGGQWTDPVGQLVRCLYVAEARSSVLSVTLRALAASIYLCAYTCAYTVHIALCISRIHIPAPNLFPHTSTERSAEIRSSKFLDTGEFRRITWTGS